MEKVRTIIVDDELASLYMLKEELRPYQQIEIIGEYKNGVDGLEGINRQEPDLVFVDIELPEMDGFQMLTGLTCHPVIVFCTGYEKYALDAWNHHAADFITKPIDGRRFSLALERAFDDIKSNRQNSRLRHQQISAGLIELSWIDQDGRKARFFSPDDIIFVRADRDYLQIHLTPELRAPSLQEKRIILKKTIKEAATEWKPHGFIQVHKSYLVNFSKVIEWDKSAGKIHLQETSEPLPVGRAFIKQVQERWQQQIHG